MNKNSKLIRLLVRKARKSGETEVSVNVPTHGYHSNPKGQFTSRTIPITANSVYRKKAKHFPAVGEPLSLMDQRKMFYGI